MANNIANNFIGQVVNGLISTRDFVVSKPFNALLVVAVLLSIAQVLRMVIWANDYPSWIGFGAYDQSQDGVRAKTLWDWMELLLVPATLALGIFLLNRLQSENERKVAKDNQHQAMLESYFDRLSELLLNNNPRDSVEGEARSIVRSRSLSLFRNLDGDRKGDALQFLYESGLIYVGVGIDLIGADLSNSQLEGATLIMAKLSGTNLSNSNLEYGNLTDAELNGINLSEANLRGCDFTGALLRGANFQGADLRDAVFYGAVLDDADFRDANVDMDLRNEVKSMEFAVMKDGRIYESVT